MGRLTTWAQNNSPFLKVPDNGEVIVIYKGYKEVDDSRNPGATKIRYIVELNGQEKWYESASARVAMCFDSIKEGEEIFIKKTVDGNKTRYDIIPVNKREPHNEQEE
jgi:hypothetical protein